MAAKARASSKKKKDLTKSNLMRDIFASMPDIPEFTEEELMMELNTPRNLGKRRESKPRNSKPVYLKPGPPAPTIDPMTASENQGSPSQRSDLGSGRSIGSHGDFTPRTPGSSFIKNILAPVPSKRKVKLTDDE
jgi:hypothetical protein